MGLKLRGHTKHLYQRQSTRMGLKPREHTGTTNMEPKERAHTQTLVSAQNHLNGTQTTNIPSYWDQTTTGTKPPNHQYQEHTANTGTKPPISGPNHQYRPKLPISAQPPEEAETVADQNTKIPGPTTNIGPNHQDEAQTTWDHPNHKNGPKHQYRSQSTNIVPKPPGRGQNHVG
uniref:Uncharacterized protein n=1 Tax=Ditylenchus dipsaci TaxID=166011 RepID=A0A915DTU4_9BILA